MVKAKLASGLAHHNEVRIVGRISGALEDREMPSGDTMVAFRVVVDRRPESIREHGPRIDTIDCSAWTPANVRRVLTWQTGDIVELTGAIRRRFWRGGSGLTSRYEIEMSSGRRLCRADDLAAKKSAKRKAPSR